MPTREEMRSLAQEIIGSYEARAAGIASLREEVSTERHAAQSQLRELHRNHQATARNQRAQLAKGRAGLKRDVGDMLQGLDQAHAAMSKEIKDGLAKGRAGLKRDVGDMLQGLDQAHAAMSKEMKDGLAKGRADLKHDVGTMLRGFDVALRRVRTALAGGRDEWQKMAATLQVKRTAPGVGVSSASAAEVPPDSAPVHQRVLDHLGSHPNGTRMTELEQEFGLSRIEMATVLKTLMGENKVEKRALEYFAI